MHDSMNTTSKRINELRDIAKRVESDPSQFENCSTPLLEKLSGMSGLKFRLLTSEIAAQMPEGNAYLELGIYQGLTPLTVARRNPGVRVVGVDDFSQFDADGANLKKIESAVEAFDIGNFEFFDADFERFLKTDPMGLKGRVGIYFFDASHDYRSQMLALMYAPDWLASDGIIVVDDCNYPHVRQATVDFLDTHPEYKLLCEFYTGQHPNRLAFSTPKLGFRGRLMRRIRRAVGLHKASKEQRPKPEDEHMRFCRETWWNGVNIIVHDPLNTLDPIFPYVPGDLREKFIKQHGFAGCNAEENKNRIAEIR